MRLLALLFLVLVAAPARAQHKPWVTGVQDVGMTVEFVSTYSAKAGPDQIWVSKSYVTLVPTHLKLTLVWKNDGSAAATVPWAVMVGCWNSDTLQRVMFMLDGVDLRFIAAGGTMTTTHLIPGVFASGLWQFQVIGYYWSGADTYLSFSQTLPDGNGFSIGEFLLP